MATTRFEKVFASGIYLLTGVSVAYIFSVNLAEGIASGYHYSIQQKLLIGAALTGAYMFWLSSILVHFRPAKAYVLAMLALPLLLWAFWPLMSVVMPPVIHRRISLPGLFRVFGIRLFAMGLLAVVTVFTPMRFVMLVRS